MKYDNVTVSPSFTMHSSEQLYYYDGLPPNEKKIYLSFVEAFPKICDLISTAFELTLVKTLDSDTSESRYYSLFGEPNLGICIHCGNKTSSAPSVSLKVIYKDLAGSWKEGKTVSASSMAIGHTDFVLCAGKKMGPLTVYTINTRSENDSGFGSRRFGIAQFEAVDYFSGDSRIGYFFTNGDIAFNLGTIVMYDKGSCMIEYATALDGAASYPKNSVWTIAMPIMYKTDTFYGYINSATCMYDINVGSTLSLGTEISVAGHVFEKLYSEKFVRVK